MKNLGTVRIETERLILRRFNMSDAEDMYNNWANDDRVTKFLTWPAHSNVDISREVLRSWTNDYSNEKFYQWCIELKEINQAIGSISVIHLSEEVNYVEIGYCIGYNFWNKGITSEALKAIIKFFFNDVQVNRIEARHDTKNPKSGKVMEKCGLVYEGTRIQADKNNTGICDIALYGLINPC
ncbi:GNAT family N-acetyltransferase [Pseudobacteroides cellulosolvens]|uniref:GCN5-related N-acetyltransferase n=1 Tax=Pseudobacteroides cellulosolvens ATCC 35603 = DSM 2933 TaxID=398512 RepID=A0A0L6JJE8_9FIRM|nr:GNAT family N-acetyltransferase [Pseudobacteroides cellulosolvens]KNY25860.1 GCN5-related N-acetyltransferase [Pseudobacteroides cellulosolvens ATCC 35603 = DSM 2933]